MGILKRNQRGSPDTGGEGILKDAIKSITKLSDEKTKHLWLSNILNSFGRELKGGFWGSIFGGCVVALAYEVFGIKSPLIWFLIGIVMGLVAGVLLYRTLRRRGWF